MDIFQNINNGIYDANDKDYKAVKSMMDNEAECAIHNDNFKKNYYNKKEIEISSFDLNLLYECNFF